AATGAMSVGRWSAMGAVMPNGGRVVVAGGANGGSYLTDSQLYDPGLGTFSVTNTLNVARTAPTVALTDGRILTAGGTITGGNPTASAETFPACVVNGDCA